MSWIAVPKKHQICTHMARMCPHFHRKSWTHGHGNLKITEEKPDAAFHRCFQMYVCNTWAAVMQCLPHMPQDLPERLFGVCNDLCISQRQLDLGHCSTSDDWGTLHCDDDSTEPVEDCVIGDLFCSSCLYAREYFRPFHRAMSPLPLGSPSGLNATGCLESLY